MNPAKRQSDIINRIRQKDFVTVNELSKTLNISKETIRRDLTELARKGLVQKVHGGASLPAVAGEGPFRERMGKNAAAKIKIAEAAAELISPGETILIDTGSTTLYFAEKLTLIPKLTVVTNSTQIAKTISSEPSYSKVFLLGGEFYGDNRQTIGSIAIEQLKSFRAHHAILTIGALDTRTGIMDYSIEEAQLARAMVDQAESLTILVDSSKFNKIASFEVCNLSRITNLVCDIPPSAELKTELMKAKINIIVANL
ncbi:transcriptional regulator, DeoR family [Desulfuromusa kysingii]|uniref:Transcriptional regulator, DeoR family n=1 Tax=Desulfuromusa kysingii TaxID=37625 RepID=A0A1H3ZYQ9_9BACT|nr:DeoR/GlpR family DNA-binding transcription regulator [Desulfuromusa kysingii]SEA28959.1 transcriptional regulator, DeoR family [Desulfuromusa kysingii]